MSQKPRDKNQHSEQRTMYCSGEGGNVTGTFVHHARYGWIHMTDPPHTVMGSPLGDEKSTPVPMMTVPMAEVRNG
jgi:hypothetical protein